MLSLKDSLKLLRLVDSYRSIGRSEFLRKYGFESRTILPLASPCRPVASNKVTHLLLDVVNMGDR